MMELLNRRYMPALQHQILKLFVLAIPVACIAWTVTIEAIFREPREYCAVRSKNSRHLLIRKFFYLFTCEYCFSHYVTILLLIITGFRLIYPDWRGYLVSGFSMVWIANVYMGLFRLIRLDIKNQKTEAELKEEDLQNRGVDRGLQD
jgi:hypothetical protein